VIYVCVLHSCLCVLATVSDQIQVKTNELIELKRSHSLILHIFGQIK